MCMCNVKEIPQYKPPQSRRAGGKKDLHSVKLPIKLKGSCQTAQQQAIFTHLGPKVLGFSVQLQEKVKTYRKRSGNSKNIMSMMSFHGSCLERPIRWPSGKMVKKKFTINDTWQWEAYFLFCKNHPELFTILTECDCFRHKNIKIIPITWPNSGDCGMIATIKISN